MKKTPKTPKTPEARRREADLIASQLDELGFAAQDLEDIRAALSRFAADGEGCTRTWKFPPLGVGVELLLSTQPHITSYARAHRLPGAARPGARAARP